jgi:hypothetical protein
MNGTASDGPPPPEDLTARVFRALYDQFDLHSTGGTHIVVPKGTQLYVGPTIGEIARQISDRGPHVPAPSGRCTAPVSRDSPEPRR